MRPGPWTVRLAPAAEADLSRILRWTEARFGREQAAAYAETIAEALAALRSGPEAIGAKAHDEVLFTLHVARKRRKGRHIIVYRAVLREGRQIVEVARILHDSMDLRRHISGADQDDE